MWEEFSTYFRGSMGPIVICGPTGCGKTEGIRSYLKRNGFMCAEVDVSDFNCPKELDTLLGSTISRSIRGSWALVVDDVEGILAYPQYASVLMKRLENQQRVCHTRIILTCNDLFSADMRPIKALIDKKIARSVCMYAPSRSVCLRYFVSYPKDWVLHATNDGENDLRQTKLFLESCLEREALRKEQGRTFEINSEPLDSHVDRSINLFSSFNQLVNRISTVDEWIRDTGDLTEWMTYSNYPLRVGSGLDSLAGIADVLSISEAQPRHFKDDLFGIGLQIFPTPTRFPPKGTLEKYPRKRERLDLDMPPIFAQECARKVDSLKVFKT